MKGIWGGLALLIGAAAGAHSASDAYLNLSTAAGAKPSEPALHGQWDIALRDLDFVLHLDDDGDGHITWGEVRRHQAEIERYAYSKLRFDGKDPSGKDTGCTIKPVRQLIAGHADGAYAALFFEVVCPSPVKLLAMTYQLFFALDPSHRAIVVMHAGADVSTAVIAPETSAISLQLE
jgi:hypothetical protein